MQKGDGQVIWFVPTLLFPENYNFHNYLKKILTVSFYEHDSLSRIAAWPWHYFLMHTLSRQWDVSYAIYFKMAFDFQCCGSSYRFTGWKCFSYITTILLRVKQEFSLLRNQSNFCPRHGEGSRWVNNLRNFIFIL